MINETDYTNNPLTKEQETRIDALFAQYDRNDTPGCAVGVIHDGRFIYKKSFGLANLDYDIPITADSKFEIASVSKQFTAVCIMLLICDHKLKMDDDIRIYLPDMPDFGSKITIKNLLNHTSGLMNYLTLLNAGNYFFAGTVRDNYLSNEAIYKMLIENNKLDFLPGENFAYSISGYLLLAEIIKKVSGKNFNQFAQEKIFGPLGMSNTFIDENCKQVVKNRVVSYNKISDGSYLRYVHNSEDVGSKGVTSTINDLFMWNENLYQGNIISLETVNLMTAKSHLNNGTEINYGFGFEIYDFGNKYIFGHGGKWLGFRSQMMRIAEYDTTVIVLANRGDIFATESAKNIVDVIM